MTVVSQQLLPMPSGWNYCWLVLRKASDEEKGKWLLKAFETMVALLASSAVAFMIGGVTGTQAIVACLTLVTLAGIRGIYFVWRGAYLTHCAYIANYNDRVNQYNATLAQREGAVQAAVEQRDSAIRALESRPLSLIDARRHLRTLENWLATESNIPHEDLTLHSERTQEIVAGLLDQDIPWATTEFVGNPEHAKRWLISRVEQIINLRESLRDGQFDAHWEPPEWFTELE